MLNRLSPARILAILLGAAGLAALSPPPSSAGTIHVYSCRQPSGAVAPVAGWTSGVNAPGGYVDTYNSCPADGGLGAQLQGVVPHAVNDAAQWTFTTPASLQIARATLWRTSSVGPAATNVTPVTFIGAPGPAFASANDVERCLTSEGCAGKGDGTLRRIDANRVVVPESHLDAPNATVTLSASCGGAGGWACPANPGGYGASTVLTAADLELLDVDPPVVSNTSGDLTVGGILQGVRSLSVRAADVGVGLRTVGLEVDGRVVAEQAFPDPAGRCTPAEDPGDGTRAYLYPTPCPTTGSATLQVDTRTISDGVRKLTIYVEDASGGRAIVGEASTTIHNSGRIGPGDPIELRGDPNGSPITDAGRLTASWRRNVPKACRKTRYRRAHRKTCRTTTSTMRAGYSTKRRDTITGTLRTADGAPISGARLVLTATPHHDAGPTVAIGSATTTAAGRYTARVPRNLGKQVTVSWMARTKDTIAAAARQVSHKIGARTTLRRSPTVARRGRVMRFSGRLTSRGAGLAPLQANVPVVVRVRYGGRWSTIGNASTDANGRWTAYYRWPKTARGRFTVRAEVRRAPRYPYESGKTASIRVRAR